MTRYLTVSILSVMVFWLSRPWTAVWTWLNAGCWQQSHLPSPGAFAVLAIPQQISFPLPCPQNISPSTFLHSPSHAPAGTEGPHSLLLSLSPLFPSPAQGDVSVQALSYSPSLKASSSQDKGDVVNSLSTQPKRMFLSVPWEDDNFKPFFR